MDFRGERKLLPALFDMVRFDGLKMFTLGIPCLLLAAMLNSKNMKRMVEIDNKSMRAREEREEKEE